MAIQSGANEGLRELALFAGAGGGILGGKLLGWRTVCAVEWEPYPACVLVSRQNEGVLSPFPIWDDVQTFDGKPWRGIVDVVSGGFPCQDISSGGKGAGIEGSRSSMWKHMARIIGEVRPKCAFVENSPLLVGRGAAMVIGDLAEMGYDAQWCIVSASDVGAPHQRDRFWLVANANSGRGVEDTGESQLWSDWLEQPPINQGASDEAKGIKRPRKFRWWDVDPADLPNPSGERGGGLRVEVVEPSAIGQGGADTTKNGHDENFGNVDNRESCHQSYVGRVADGVAARLDRLKAIGNGQVPIVAATAFRILTGEI